jgi:hypothetical protein
MLRRIKHEAFALWMCSGFFMGTFSSLKLVMDWSIGPFWAFVLTTVNCGSAWVTSLLFLLDGYD